MAVPRRRRSLDMSTRSAEAMATSVPCAPMAMPTAPALSAREVVNAVANDHGPVAGSDFAQHFLHFRLGKRFGAHIRNAHDGGDALGHRCAIAGEEHLPLQAEGAQAGEGLGGFAPGLVGEEQPAEEPAAQGHAGDGSVVRGRRRGGDAEIGEEIGPAEGCRLARHRAGDAETACLPGILHLDRRLLAKRAAGGAG